MRSSVFAKASNTLKSFSCMLCKGASNVESSTNIYRVSWPLVAIGGWPMVLFHVSWGPPAFTLKSGWTFWTSECCCVLDDLYQGSSWSSYGSSYMNVWWVSGFIICMSDEFMGFVQV